MRAAGPDSATRVIATHRAISCGFYRAKATYRELSESGIVDFTHAKPIHFSFRQVLRWEPEQRHGGGSDATGMAAQTAEALRRVEA